MQKKVLLVDDSALMRRVISDIINSDDRFHVEKVATNGLEALNLIQNSENFDAIILDINMPKMGGLEFLKRLEQTNVKTKVIVVSTVAKDGAKETIMALEYGAFDFITKPESYTELKNENFKNKILNCLMVALDLKSSSKQIPYDNEIQNVQLNNIGNHVKNNTTNFVLETKNTRKKKIVAIACSTGGPKALQKIIPLLPEKLGCSVLIVQHMPVGFTLSLANRLNELSKIQVKEVENNEILKVNTVYIAKGGNQMRIINLGDGNHNIQLTSEPARNGLRPCADIMYETLIDSGYDDIICVVLTGMGSDGTNGITQLKKKKSIHVIAQEETSCTVYGMPKVVIESGLANEIVSLDQIANIITKNVGVQ